MTPNSLRQICVEFVARNAHLLDSLEDFPEDVAKSIWKEADFSAGDDNAAAALAVFAKAFPDVILPDLKVPSLLALDHFSTPFYALLSSVSALDVSDCALGDSHHLLSHLHAMPHLSHLAMANAALTSAGVQRMLRPAAVLGGFEAVTYLDLRSNDVGESALVRCTKVMRALRTLVASLARTSHTSARASSFVKPHFTVRSEATTTPRPVSTRGWAADFVTVWQRHVEDMLRRREEAFEARKTSFYGASRQTLKRKLDGSRVARETVVWERAEHRLVQFRSEDAVEESTGPDEDILSAYLVKK